MFSCLSADSAQTIELIDLDNTIANQYNLPSIPIPHSLKTKNEQLIYKFHSILRSVHEELTTMDEYQNDLVQELERFNEDHSSRQEIVYLSKEMQIKKNEKLLNYIEKMKTLVNKLETMEEKHLQYHFLYSKLDRFGEILRNDYGIELPGETNFDAIRLSLNKIRKKTRRQLDELERRQIDLRRKLDVLRKKEELKHRTTAPTMTAVN